MDNSEIAKKHGINRKMPHFFSEECLKFYSENDIEIIQKETLGLFDLQFFSGYEYDDKEEYYTKTNGTLEYEFDGKKYDLFEYKDCFAYYVFICNEKLKKFRHIILSDYKDFDGDGVYLYKDKFYCQYYDATKSLFFFNRNQYISLPGPFIMNDLKRANSSEFISRYYKIEDGNGYVQPNISEFYADEDEAILIYFHDIYEKIMRELFKKEKPSIYKETIEKEEKEFDDIKGLDISNKNALKTYYLYATKEFTDFCNAICGPEIFNKELLKNGEVRKNLKNNFLIYHEFNSSLRDPNNDFIQGEDFTFLIINAIKSLEYLLYRKIRNYEDFKKIDNDKQISEKTMLDNLIYYIEKHREMFRKSSEDKLSKDNYESLIKAYIKLLYYVKDECRNGFFHKERIDTYDSLCEKREAVLEAIARTIILLK